MKKNVDRQGLPSVKHRVSRRFVYTYISTTFSAKKMKKKLFYLSKGKDAKQKQQVIF